MTAPRPVENCKPWSKVAHPGGRNGKHTREVPAVTINKTARRAVSAIKAKDEWTFGREGALWRIGSPAGLQSVPAQTISWKRSSTWFQSMSSWRVHGPLPAAVERPGGTGAMSCQGLRPVP